MHNDFKVAEPPQAISDCGHTRGPLARVRNHRIVAGQFRCVVCKKLLKIRPAHLFFTLNHINHIHWQPTTSLHPGFSRLEMREELTFIVCSAPCIKIAALLHRLKGFRIPTIAFFCRLNIVMTINQDGRLTLKPRRSAQNNRMPGRLNQLGRYAAPIQIVAHKLSRLTRVGIVGWLGTHRRNPDQGLELLFKSSRIL